MRRVRFLLACCASGVAGAWAAAAEPAAGEELVYVDDQQVIRWRADDREVALFGANYCLPSASDYRAAGYLHVDRKRLIEQDMAHFARMGWDGMRLALWGDWENSDREGNLIANEHLDLLDYLLFRAKQRGIFMLLTPIHRHTALWPDGRDNDTIQGFSKHYPARELGRNPAAIRAQQNYIRQLLNHVNPYTGVALKNEPAILFVEMINEPEHHSDDFDGSVAYINALADAVRSTGCEKLLFHNLSQDFRMGPAIAASRVHGFSFGWYPTNLVARRTLEENYLRWVDHYSPLLRPDAPRLPSIVYEFDTADMLAGYMYPAMVRSFREAGAQFATMFAYDFLATAPFNLGWQTHYMNLVYSPQKAVSAIIAAEAMRTLPRGAKYGEYPDNRRFEAFRVSYEENLSEMVRDDAFFHSNSTASRPAAPARLQKVIGVGNSPVAQYEGNGAYFIDRVSPAVWRLEVYPDVLVVQDPFAQRLNYREVSMRLISREWPMTLHLLELGDDFTVKPLDHGNEHTPLVARGTFLARPGVYLLAARGAKLPAEPERVGRVGWREFVCPAAPDLPPQVVLQTQDEYPAGRPVSLEFDLASPTHPREVHVFHRRGGGSAWEKHSAHRTNGYRYRADLLESEATVGEFEYFVEAELSGTTRFPATGSWKMRVVAPDTPLMLFDAAIDGSRIFAMRGAGDFFQIKGADAHTPASLRLSAPETGRLARHAVSLPIKSRISNRGDSMPAARTIRVRAAGSATTFRLTLLEDDGTAWQTTMKPSESWSVIDVPTSALRIGQGLKLPLGYPGNWNFEFIPSASPGRRLDGPRWTRIEHVQFEALPAEGKNGEPAHLGIASVELRFD